MRLLNTFTILAIVLGLSLSSSGCTLTRPKPGEVRSPENALTVDSPPVFFDDASSTHLYTAIENSLDYYRRLNDSVQFQFGPDTYSKEDLVLTLESMKAALTRYGLTEDFFHHMRDSYQFYKVPFEDFLVTGYFIPKLKGSFQRSGRYRFPLYRRPADLIAVDLKAFNLGDGLPGTIYGRLTQSKTLIPYHDRAAIDHQHSLDGKNFEVLWVDDQIDLFFLHIQGSGLVELPNGKLVSVTYSAKNGRPYRSLGAEMIRRELLSREAVSMQSIKHYLHAHPEQVEELLSTNPSYVFFSLSEKGAVGSLNVPVTAGRTIATDSAVFPKGAPGFLVTEKPVLNARNEIASWKPSSRFVLNQDTGGAIKGAGRVDLFTGTGLFAEIWAGHLKHRGELYFFVKKSDYDRDRGVY